MRAFGPVPRAAEGTAGGRGHLLTDPRPVAAARTAAARTGFRRQPASPNSLAISIRWTSLVPSPISRILESRHMRATGYSFMKP